MKNKKVGYILSFLLIVGCGDEISRTNTENKNNQSIDYQEYTESISKEEIPNWSNPVLGAFGTSLGNTIRAYYLAGDFATVKRFTITEEPMSLEEFSTILRASDWGYEIKLTNLHWEADSTFILTYRTKKENTTGMEQYHGKVVNDTAKLYFEFWKHKH